MVVAVANRYATILPKAHLAGRTLLRFAVSISANFTGSTIGCGSTFRCNDTHSIRFNEPWGAFALVVDTDLVWTALVGVNTLFALTCFRVTRAVAAILLYPMSVNAD